MEEIIKAIESCGYECAAGPLENNTDWIKIKKILGAVSELIEEAREE